MLAWIANQPDKLAQWARYDRSQNPDDDPYVTIGRALGHSETNARAKGKIADLAFGYQGGAGAYKNFAAENDTSTDAEIEAHKRAWRARHPQITQFWYGIDRAAIAAVNRAPQPIDYGRLTLQCERQGDAAFLYITLPSGRRMSYPLPKLITNRFGYPAVEFMDNSLTNGGWVPCNYGHGAYGGLWTENIVSGIARDLLAAAMVRLEAAGYSVTLHVHDEIVCELPDGVGSVDEFKHLVEQLPDWAAGLPVAARVRNGPRFAEVNAPVVHIAGATEAPPAAKSKPRQAAKQPALSGPLPAYPPITEIGFDAADPRGRLVAWVPEREAIRLRRALGRQAPWTTEPILAAGRFCNAYREYDRVTLWVAANVVQPHRNDRDLWFSVVVVRCCSNEPDALAELLPYVLPFDAAGFRGKVEALLAGGRKVYRTNAYKPVMPPRELKGISLAAFHTDHILGPMWRDRERLRPQSGETLAAYSARLEECPHIGPFYAGQVVADLKPVAPLCDTLDRETFARPGPGSERGLNRARGRPVKAAWSEAHWYRELTALHAETKPLFAAAGLAPLDMQNLQNCLCEWDKWERARDEGGKPSRKYKPAGPLPQIEAEPEHPTATTIIGVMAAPAVAAADSPPAPDEPEPADTEASAAADALAYILADIEQRDAAAAAKPQQKPPAEVTPAANKTDAPPGGNSFGNEQRRHSSSGSSPHGSSGAPRGEAQRTHIYYHPDLPPPHHYLLVEKRIETSGKRHFWQYHWANGRWNLGVKDTYAQRRFLICSES